MPAYVITCRGGLLVGKSLKPTGSTIELSAKDAAALPFGTVELAPAPVAPPLVVPPPPAPKPEGKPKKDTKS